MTTVLLVRHGLTATTGQLLTGWTPGVGLDERGRAQAKALGERLAAVPLDAIVSSPLDRCRQTVEELKSRGVEFVSDVLEFPWGYVAQFRDPDGKRLQLREGR